MRDARRVVPDVGADRNAPLGYAYFYRVFRIWLVVTSARWGVASVENAIIQMDND